MKLPMKYNFDKVISRRETHSTKWLKFDDTDVLPMWIADMDFKCPLEIIKHIQKRIDQGIFGYTDEPNNLSTAFIRHVEKTLNWRIEKDWIVWVPGGVVGLSLIHI